MSGLTYVPVGGLFGGLMLFHSSPYPFFRSYLSTMCAIVGNIS